MSLRTFHIIFICLASLMSFGFGGWAISYYRSVGKTLYLPFGMFSFLFGIGLVIYGISFIRKPALK